jgi:hypothetical protein
MSNAPTMRPHDFERPKWKRNDKGPRTAFPLVRGLDRLSQQSAPGGIRTPNLLIRKQSGPHPPCAGISLNGPWPAVSCLTVMPVWTLDTAASVQFRCIS